jgi:hypothetical protein
VNASDVIESARSAEWVNQERELRALASDMSLTAAETERIVDALRDVHYLTVLRGFQYTCPPGVSHDDAKQIEAVLYAWAAEALAKRRVLMLRIAGLLIELELSRRH